MFVWQRCISIQLNIVVLNASYHLLLTYPLTSLNRQLTGLKKFNLMIWFYISSFLFVVKNDGDYSVDMSDPDLLVAWPKIEEVHIDSHGPSLACPICLYPPNAANMTKWAKWRNTFTVGAVCCIIYRWAIGNSARVPYAMSPFKSMIYRVFAW